MRSTLNIPTSKGLSQKATFGHTVHGLQFTPRQNISTRRLTILQMLRPFDQMCFASREKKLRCEALQVVGESWPARGRASFCCCDCHDWYVCLQQSSLELFLEDYLLGSVKGDCNYHFKHLPCFLANCPRKVIASAVRLRVMFSHSTFLFSPCMLLRSHKGSRMFLPFSS